MSKKLYRDDIGKFTIKSCKGVEQYLYDQCGIQVQVSNTGTFFVCNYILNGKLETDKIRLWPGPLYCVKEEDFKDLISKINEGVVF